MNELSLIKPIPENIAASLDPELVRLFTTIGFNFCQQITVSSFNVLLYLYKDQKEGGFCANK